MSTSIFARSLLAPTVLRQTETGGWLLMNRREGGWKSFCYGPFLTLDDARADFAFVITGAGEDECSTFFCVAPVPA